MGCGGSTENKIADDPSPTPAVGKVDQNRVSAKTDEPATPVVVRKLLLLGVGGVGKSTVFKQIKQSYTTGFTEIERAEYQFGIVSQINRVMNKIVREGIQRNLIDLNSSIESLYEELQNIPEIKDLKNKDIILQLKDAVLQLWGMKEVKEGFSKFAAAGVPDTSNDYTWASYFLDKAEMILSDGYEVTQEDMMRLRRETSGSQDIKFQYKAMPFHIIDLGGQAHERINWEQHYEGVLAVIYMIALSDYAESLAVNNQGNSNKLKDAFKLFSDLINYKAFKKTPFVVLFNKNDLFADKLKKMPFSFYNPDVVGDEAMDPSYCIELLKGELEMAAGSAENFGRVSVYETNATDAKLIQNTFESVTTSVLSLSTNMSFMGGGAKKESKS